MYRVIFLLVQQFSFISSDITRSGYSTNQRVVNTLHVTGLLAK